MTSTSGIIIIGDEILSGRTKDLNINWIATELNQIGIRLLEARVIPDDMQTIIESINEFRKKFTYVFSCGGIGPTHDDITSESVSKAFGMTYGPHKDAFKILEKYYKTEEFNKGRQKMAWMPLEAKLILNPTSGAPGFYIENVFCLPGVPSILKSMLGGIQNKIVGGDPILSLSINLKTVESEIAKSLSDVQNKNLDVEIGSYPFFKAGKLGVSLVLRGTDQSKINNCSLEIYKIAREKNIQIIKDQI